MICCRTGPRGPAGAGFQGPGGSPGTDGPQGSVGVQGPQGSGTATELMWREAYAATGKALLGLTAVQISHYWDDFHYTTEISVS